MNGFEHKKNRGLDVFVTLLGYLAVKPLYTVSRKKGATDFFAVTFTIQILTDFHNFSCTTSQENAKVIGAKISRHTFVMLLPYRVKVSDTKVTHFVQY